MISGARDLSCAGTVALFLILIPQPLTAIEGISPGEADVLVQAATACPAFSWEIDLEASLYELAVFAVAEQEKATVTSAADPPYTKVLYRQISGRATSWSPPARDCLAPGGRYVWFVRPVYEDDEGSWSPGRYFSTPAAPTDEDVQHALAVLDAWQRSQGVPAVSAPAAGSAAVPAPAQQAPPTRDSLASVPNAPDVSSGIPAIRGEQADPTGETYGVVGIVSSATGAGIGAANLDGGPDLILDGVADGTPSTFLSESGIDRPDGSIQPFTLQNSGAGEIHLEVIGRVTANAYAGDGSRLTNVEADMLDDQHGAFYLDASNATGMLHSDRFSAIEDLQNEKLLDNDDGKDLLTRDQADFRFVNVPGDTMTGGLTVDADGASLIAKVTSAEEFPGDVIKLEVRNTKNVAQFSVDTEGDVVGNSFTGDGAGLANVTSDDLACNGCVGSTDLQNGGVSNADIANDAITTAKIAANTVTAADIATNGVAAAEIAAGAVGTSEIADGTVGSADLATGAVTSSKIGAGAVDADAIHAGVVSTDKLANDAVTSAKIAANAVGSSEIATAAVTAAELAENSVGASELMGASVQTSHLVNDAVIGSKIADDAVDTEHLAAGAVDSLAIANQSIQGLDIANDAITSSEINDLSIISADLGVGSVTSAKILDGTITAADIADGAIDYTEIATGAVRGAEILDGAVNTVDLANSAVGNAKIADAAVTSAKIASETITAADVDPAGGLYASKQSLYAVDLVNSVPAGYFSSFAAACADSNDLGITWSCDGGTGIELRRVELSNWTISGMAAMVRCYVENQNDIAVDATARIYCVAVPGS